MVLCMVEASRERICQPSPPVSQSRLSAALPVTAADVGEGPGKQCWPIPMV